MRPLTKNEQVLAAVFAGILLLMVLLVGLSALRRAIAADKAIRAGLVNQLEELNNWAGQREALERRAAWLRDNPPPLWDESDSPARLVGELQQSLAAGGIEINSQRLLETTVLPGYYEIGVQLNLKATTEELVRWLHSIQRPGAFIAIRQINLRSDADKTHLRVEISLIRHYLDPGADPAQPGSTPGMQPTMVPMGGDSPGGEEIPTLDEPMPMPDESSGQDVSQP